MLIGILGLSCNNIKKVTGHSFEYISKNRKLELIFDSNSNCELRNTFNCRDLPPNVRKISINCTYKQMHDTICLKNIACNNDPLCKKTLTIEIPPQINQSCFFLSDESRKKKFIIGPNYESDYEKYGMIPNIGLDTLYIVKNKIVLYKKDSSGSVGFIFSREKTKDFIRNINN